jgi:PAS domain S-box-containing protein
MTDVSCRALQAYFDILRELGVDLERFLAGVAPPPGKESEVDLRWLQGQGHRVSWNTFARILDKATPLLPPQAIAERFSQKFTQGKAMWFPRKATMIGLVTSPQRLYWTGAHWVGPFNFSNLRRTFRHLDDGRIEIVQRLREEDEASEEYFRLTTIIFRIMPRLIGLGDAQVETGGDARAMRWLIKPPASGTIWARIGRCVRLLFAGPALLQEMSAQDLELRDANSRLTAVSQQLEAKVSQRTLELEATNARLRALVDEFNEAQSIAKVGSWEWDPRTEVVRWSPETYRIFGLASDSAPPTAQLVTQRIPPGDLQRLSEAMRRVRSEGGSFDLEHSLVTADGETRHVHVRGEWVTPQGQGPRLIGTIHDITARRRYEASLIEAKTLADQANRLKSTFLANVSHEIRTPMTAILGFAELLGNPALPPEKRTTYSEVILRNGRHLLAVINDILDLAKVESGHPWVVPGPVNLAREIAQAVDFLRGEAERKGLTVTLDVSRDVPEKVVTDATRLRQIVLNVLGNAIKFTDAGGVTVAVAVAEDPERIAVDVIDTGPGIKEATTADLFQPLVHSAERVRSSPQSGAGLGLALSRSLARALGGDVVLLSTALGVGTAFRITLARALPGTTTTQGEVPLPGGATLRLTPSASAVVRRVAIQFGDLRERVTVERALESLGATVTSVDPSEGATLPGLDLASLAIDAVVADDETFGADPSSVARGLRAKGFTGLIVAVGGDDERKRALHAAGCGAVLDRPIDVLALLRAVATAVPPP